MVLILPYDIWCHIASFIPKPNLIKLYSINSLFLHLALKEVYREVNIDDTGNERTLRCLFTMSATVAHHVDSLILRPHLFGNSALRFPLLEESVWKCLRHMNKTAKPSNFVASRIFLRHIAQMTEVKSLMIRCFPWDDIEGFKSALAFVRTAWSMLQSRLRILNLSIPMEAYSNSGIFPLNLVMQSLEELTIVLWKAYSTTDDGEIFSPLIPFINQQHKSLISLAIDTPDGGVDPSPLFNALCQFPCLTRLSISHLRFTDCSGIDVFLMKHAQRLEDYKIRFHVAHHAPTPTRFFSHPMFQIDMPQLTSLDLGVFQWPKKFQVNVTDGLVRCIGRAGPRLTRLVVRDCALTFSQVVSLVFVVGSETSQLRSLEMYIYSLSCSLLDLLSQKLPMLHHLELWLINQDDGTWITNDYWNGFDTPALAFIQDMAHRKYPDWALRYFTVWPLYISSERWDESRKLLVSALPVVISFNGLSGEEFVDLPDYSKCLE